MGKLKLTGRALGWVYNFRSGCMHTMHLLPGVAIQPSLELKTRPKPVLTFTMDKLKLPDWLNEERLERAPRLEYAQASRKCGRACKGVHTLFTGQRERERDWIFMLARVRTPSSTVRERERERERKRERERCRIWLFLFLKGMTGALAPFTYLVTSI
jgi:hypothetical protein